MYFHKAYPSITDSQGCPSLPREQETPIVSISRQDCESMNSPLNGRSNRTHRTFKTQSITNDAPVPRGRQSTIAQLLRCAG